MTPLSLNTAVKCNPDPVLIGRLAELGVNFDCASLGEMRSVIALGVSTSRIIFTNPIKSVASLRYARKMGINTMVFDNAQELGKISTIFPGARLLLRITVDDSSAMVQLSHKFGATPTQSTHLLRLAVDLGLEVVGISFHIGTSTWEPTKQDIN
jgi:ornithine decarboxylase